MRKTIAVDFDGVIHAYSQGWKDGSIYDKPVEGAKDQLQLLLKEYNVFILTTRDPGQVEGWMEQHIGLPTLILDNETDRWDIQGRIGITNRKLPAIAYIDDRAIRFTNWSDIKKYFM